MRNRVGALSNETNSTNNLLGLELASQSYQSILQEESHTIPNR